MHIYVHVCVWISTYEMQTTHGWHPLSNAESFLEIIKIFWKIAHPWWDSNPRPPYYMPSIHMCINAYIDILWVQWHNVWCYYTHRIRQTCKADHKKDNLMGNDICHKQTLKWKCSIDFTACLPIFFDSAYLKTLIYQIWCFPPEVKIPTIFCHISATLF